MKGAATLSPGHRLQYINDDRKLKRRFRALDKDERRLVLEGMKLSVHQDWIIKLLRDARKLRTKEK